MKPTHKVMFISTKNVMGPSSRQTSKCASWKISKPSLATPFGHLLCWYFERRWVLIESHN
jgi:hypothetical protein